MNAGSEANKSGKAWERWVRGTAADYGFQILPHAEREACTIPLHERKILWLNAPYKTIFGQTKEQKNRTVTEFVLETKAELVRIECKWQNVSGSVDEKIPFMYLNAVLTMEEPTIAFAFGGQFYHTNRGKLVINWLQKVAKNPPEWLSETAKKNSQKKEIIVLTNDTFDRWFRERFSR